MTEIDLLQRVAVLVALAGIIGPIAVCTVEALRRRIGAIDGWRVLVVAAVAVLAITALLLRPWEAAPFGPAAVHAIGVALFAWLIAVGGDAELSKQMRKARVVTLVTSDGKADSDG